MPAIRREAVASVVIAFLLPSSLATNRSLKISETLLLPHLKKSRRKRMILTQIALRNTCMVMAKFTCRIARRKNRSRFQDCYVKDCFVS